MIQCGIEKGVRVIQGPRLSPFSALSHGAFWQSVEICGPPSHSNIFKLKKKYIGLQGKPILLKHRYQNKLKGKAKHGGNKDSAVIKRKV